MLLRDLLVVRLRTGFVRDLLERQAAVIVEAGKVVGDRVDERGVGELSGFVPCLDAATDKSRTFGVDLTCRF